MSLRHGLRVITRHGVQCRNRLLLSAEAPSIPFCQPNLHFGKRCTFDFTAVRTIAVTHPQNYFIQRSYSSDSKNPDDSSKDEEKNLTVFQRFTQVYNKYGKTLIGVHMITSALWYGGFYLIARSGIDLLPLLVKLGASASVQAKYSAAGDFVVAYLLYEIAKPVRYAFTLVATRQAVVYMRKTGYLPPIKPEDKLRNLAKDGRDNLKDKYQEQKDDMKNKYDQKKAEYRKRWHKARQRMAMRSSSFRNRHDGSHTHKRNGTHHTPKLKKPSDRKPFNK